MGKRREELERHLHYGAWPGGLARQCHHGSRAWWTVSRRGIDPWISGPVVIESGDRSCYLGRSSCSAGPGSRRWCAPRDHLAGGVVSLHRVDCRASNWESGTNRARDISVNNDEMARWWPGYLIKNLARSGGTDGLVIARQAGIEPGKIGSVIC
nr:hypothetical protein [Candidatus Sigynarchaeota archaeon]